MKKIKFPTKCKTFQDKTHFLIKEIKECFKDINDIEKSATSQACQLGALLSELKKHVKNKKQNWETYFKKHLPHFGKGIRTAQRYMKLSKKIDLDEYPNLGFLGLNLLHQLVALAGKKEVSDFLNNNDIEVDFEDDDKIEAFRCDVEELIDSLKTVEAEKDDKDAVDADDPEDESTDDSEDNNEDDREDDSVDAKSQKKIASTKTIVHDFDQTATTFIKSIEGVMENEKAVKSNRKQINNIIKEVKAKLAALKEYQKSLRGGKKSKKK